MGTEIPGPVVTGDVPRGNACVVCWGPGKPFGDGDTPSIIIVRISGVNKADDWVPADGEPINGEFEIPQSFIISCLYELQVGFGRVAVLFRPGDTDVSAENDQGRFPFAGQSVDPCGTEISNDVVSGFTSGTAFITIPETLP